MTTFTLTIASADGTTIFHITTESATTCLIFMKTHDHTGATSRLFITDDAAWKDSVFADDNIYAALDDWIYAGKDADLNDNTHGWGV